MAMDEDAAFWKHASDLANNRIEEMIIDRDRWQRDAITRSIANDTLASEIGRLWAALIHIKCNGDAWSQREAAKALGEVVG